MRSSFILIFTRAMRLSKTYSFSGNVVRKSRPRTQYFVLILMFLAPVSLYNGFNYRSYLSCFVERQNRRFDKICRLVPRCLGLNTVFFVVATWLTKVSTDSELQKQLARNISLAFIIFLNKNDKGIWLKLSQKKGGVKHNRNAIIILHTPFFLARIESNPCK